MVIIVAEILSIEASAQFKMTVVFLQGYYRPRHNKRKELKTAMYMPYIYNTELIGIPYEVLNGCVFHVFKRQLRENLS